MLYATNCARHGGTSIHADGAIVSLRVIPSLHVDADMSQQCSHNKERRPPAATAATALCCSCFLVQPVQPGLLHLQLSLHSTTAQSDQNAHCFTCADDSIYVTALPPLPAAAVRTLQHTEPHKLCPCATPQNPPVAAAWLIPACCISQV